ncbi:universal stress protein [Streptomyces sp. NPDC008238]
MGGLVVVGADGSASSLAAVETAAMEAAWRGAALRVVHAFLWPAMHVPLGPSGLGPPEGGLRNAARRVVAEAVERARSVVPDVDVTHAVVTGEPLTVLEAQSRAAELVVVGSRGMGGFVGLLLGSTAVHLAAHGQCPVMVVSERPSAGGPVLLGVDGSPAGADAVGFAFTEAALRGADLLALHAGPHAAGEPGEATRAGERLVAEAVAERREDHPGVTVRTKAVRGGTRETLIEESRTAQLLVVGARGRGGFAGLVLGSVSQALLHHAHCPVAVVRGSLAAR